MYVYLEESEHTTSSCGVNGISWMGKVPDLLPNEDGWRLNRFSYYQEGWLATGNEKGIVSVTYTSCNIIESCDPPRRSNFNLRGHNSQVLLVKWNEPYQKLATCDASGIIFVWIKYKGRWSIELINDRSVPVTDFVWSHDGRMALVCYADGFVLVGSVAGQRYWSSMLNVDNAMVTCGAWTPDDKQVMLGTHDGRIIVLDAQGQMVSQVSLLHGEAIAALCWSCEKFNMEETDSEESAEGKGRQQQHILAVVFKVGAIHLIKSYDDLCPTVIRTNLEAIRVEWSNAGDVLAVCGSQKQSNLLARNLLHLYSSQGQLRVSIPLPSQLCRDVSCITWGHNDRRLFLAVESQILVAWVHKKIPTLQLLCKRTIQRYVDVWEDIPRLGLPRSLSHSLRVMCASTVKGITPNRNKLREFVSHPPSADEQLHCTMVRTGDDWGGCYTLYVEYLGGLIPILKGRRASKIRPDFVIYDPTPTPAEKRAKASDEDVIRSSSGCSSCDSDNDLEFGSRSPLPHRSKTAPTSNGKASSHLKPPKGLSVRRRSAFNERESSKRASMRQREYHSCSPKLSRHGEVDHGHDGRPSCSRQMSPEGKQTRVVASQQLPQERKLVEITSNIWGTKFKIMGCAPSLPRYLGQVTYKTSLLHLQPRQMTIVVNELNPSQVLIDPAMSDPSETGHFQCFSEDEDDDDHGGRRSHRDSGIDYCNEDTLSPVRLNSGPSHVVGIVNDSHVALVSQPRSPPVQRHIPKPSGHAKENHPKSPIRQANKISSQPRPAGCDIYSPRGKKSLFASFRNGKSPLSPLLLRTKSLRKKARKLAEQHDLYRHSDSGDSAGCDQEVSALLATQPADDVPGCSKWLDERRNEPPIRYIDDEDESETHRRRTYSFKEKLSLSDPAIHMGSGVPPSDRRNSSTPSHRSVYKNKVQSPLLPQRRLHSPRPGDSSDDEAFQRDTHLKRNSFSDKDLTSLDEKSQLKPSRSRSLNRDHSLQRKRRMPRQFVMYNKAPVWNENSQVYQLDFGGRVTQESAKNFKIEYKGKQVLQFGRIDGNAYTLDFQWPFTALQAFAVALANVTQRLK